MSTKVYKQLMIIDAFWSVAVWHVSALRLYFIVPSIRTKNRDHLQISPGIDATSHDWKIYRPHLNTFISSF